MSWSIQSIYNDFLEEIIKRDETKSSDYWRGSDMGSCFRKRFYERKGIQKTEAITARVKRVLDTGNMYHWHYQTFFKRMGLLIEKEVEIKNKEYNFKGHCDLIAGGIPQEIKKENFEFIDKNNEKRLLETMYNFAVRKKEELFKEFPEGMPKLLYEFKTQHSQSFTYIEETAQEEHILQCGSYLLFVKYKYPDIQEGRILYISKDDARIVEHIVKLTPQLQDKILSELNYLNLCWTKDELPPQLPEFEGKSINWKCRFCPFLTYCRGENWEINLKKQRSAKIKQVTHK